MVRSVISAGAALTCCWSVLFGMVQAATINADGQFIQGSGDSSTGNSVVVLNPPPVINTVGNTNGSSSSYNAVVELLNADIGMPVIFPDNTIVFFVPPPPPPQPSVFPAPKNQLSFKRVIGSLIAGRRGVSVFEGLIENNSNGQSGYARFVLNRAGRGSVSVSLNGEPKRVIPVGVDESGALSSNSADASVSGQLVTFSDGSVGVDAVINDAGQQMPVRALRAAPPQEVIDAVKGSYTLVFDNQTSGVLLQTGLTGFGTLRVNKRGAVTFSGKLSDGATFSQGTKLNSAGNWPLYAKGRGPTVLSGTVSFADLGDSDCSGTLQWRRSMGQIVGSAQTATISLLGSRYLPAEAFGDISSWNFSAYSMTGSTLVSASLAPAPRNAFLLTSSTAGTAKVQLAKGTGRLSGSFLRPNIPFRQTITGVIFQKTNQGLGLFTTQTSSSASVPRSAGGTPGFTMPWLGRFTLNAGSTAFTEASSVTPESAPPSE